MKGYQVLEPREPRGHRHAERGRGVHPGRGVPARGRNRRGGMSRALIHTTHNASRCARRAARAPRGAPPRGEDRGAPGETRDSRDENPSDPFVETEPVCASRRSLGSLGSGGARASRGGRAVHLAEHPEARGARRPSTRRLVAARPGVGARRFRVADAGGRRRPRGRARRDPRARPRVARVPRVRALLGARRVLVVESGGDPAGGGHRGDGRGLGGFRASRNRAGLVFVSGGRAAARTGKHSRFGTAASPSPSPSGSGEGFTVAAETRGAGGGAAFSFDDGSASAARGTNPAGAPWPAAAPPARAFSRLRAHGSGRLEGGRLGVAQSEASPQSLLRSPFARLRRFGFRARARSARSATSAICRRSGVELWAHARALRVRDGRLLRRLLRGSSLHGGEVPEVVPVLLHLRQRRRERGGARFGSASRRARRRRRAGPSPPPRRARARRRARLALRRARFRERQRVFCGQIVGRFRLERVFRPERQLGAEPRDLRGTRGESGFVRGVASSSVPGTSARRTRRRSPR